MDKLENGDASPEREADLKGQGELQGEGNAQHHSI
jgi:hypothetical protein